MGMPGCNIQMSKSSDPEFNLELHFLPAWAQQPTDANRYAEYEGERDRGEGRDRNRGPGRRPRPEGGGGRRVPAGGDAGRIGSGGRGPGRPDRPPRGRGGRRPYEPRPQEAMPLPELDVAFIPDDHGVDSLAKQIRMTGRAYPLFEIARMVLQKPERHAITLSVKKNAEGQPRQPLFSCAIDDTLWLSEDEAVQHVLGKHFSLFYQPERIQTEPPKGTYTFVAQCGMSGVILGPPNYHDYQNQLRKLHAARFSRMPFEAFKARVKIVKDTEVVKKWIEDQSFKTEYNCLNLPEPLKLGSREEVERHFRATHASNIIRQVETASLKATAVRDLRSPALVRLILSKLDEQRRFPIQVVTVLSQQFASRGLQFFKVNRTVTHVAVARPHFLDLESIPVSESVKSIVDFINQHSGCTRKQLLEAFIPGSMQKRPPPPAPSGSDGEQAVASIEPSPEETALITDLHWLIHQGHVIEFANGAMETAKKPIVKPPKPVQVPQPQPPPEKQAFAPESGSALEDHSEEQTPSPLGEGQSVEGSAPSESLIAPESRVPAVPAESATPLDALSDSQPHPAPPAQPGPDPASDHPPQSLSEDSPSVLPPTAEETAENPVSKPDASSLEAPASEGLAEEKRQEGGESPDRPKPLPSDPSA
jgi:hypothetical protein